jgi:TolB-like protein/Tfp pilus assembly protein PilF/predicted Ser/Thr protein kinase
VVGKTISHYRILDKLGEGGMGVVYKAQDTKLDRIVALKFLPQHLTSDSVEKERFVQEAKAASALNHPNITTIHEIDEFEGQMFIVMEYCEGKTLKQIIEKETLSIRKVLDIGIQICEGLTIAHEKGIVHRDIKSANIMLTPRGQVKIMDFGLAKLKGATRLTQTRSTLGTAAYMSPEQAQGEEVDQRSDIFSFGVVLYELLTGKLPFGGEHQAAIVYSIINEEPQPVGRYNNQVSTDLERIVSKALVKEKEERYQHIDDLLADLRREKKSLEYVKTGPLAQPVATRKPVKRKTLPLVVAGLAVLIVIVGYFALLYKKELKSGSKMLAVLPFENLGAPEQEYFAAGITEEITTQLAKVSGLGVISRTSVLQYKDTRKTVQQIGKELGVQYVLEGTILWDKSEVNSRVRINPQLIRVKDGIHVWAETYDRALEQIFALQSDVAEKVASALDVTLLETEKGSMAARPTDNLQAYEYYLRGNEYRSRSWDEKDYRIAIQMYEKAVELDPRFALAYCGLSRAHEELYWYYYDRTQERLKKAKEAVDRALELKPDLPEAHLALGYYYYHGSLDYDHASEQFAIAQKDQPNNSELLLAIGAIQRRQGKWEQAVTNIKKAAELDPRSNTMAVEVAWTYSAMRKYAEAEHYFDQAISLAPDWTGAYDGKARLGIYSEGNTKKARKVLQDATGKADMSQLVSDLVWLDILDGDYQVALARLPGLAAFIDAYGFNDTTSYFLTKAQIYGLLSQPQMKAAYFDSARIILENRVQSRPGEALFHSQLGLAYAGLGRREEAIREGKKGVELLPVSKDAFEGGVLSVANLAQIYVMVGDYDEAIDQLEYLLSIPGYLTTIPFLRIDPTWAPLRNHPRFQKLLARNK